jgi:hypothetical protein
MKAVTRLMTPALLTLATALLCAGPAIAGSADQAKEKVAKAQAKLEEVRQKTDGWGLWKSTNKVLGNAEQSLQQGDYDAAIEAAEEVIFQANKGIAQYREEKTEHTKAVNAASQNGDLKEDAWAKGES